MLWGLVTVKYLNLSGRCAVGSRIGKISQPIRYVCAVGSCNSKISQPIRYVCAVGSCNSKICMFSVIHLSGH